jgi:hypothetical protein
MKSWSRCQWTDKEAAQFKTVSGKNSEAIGNAYEEVTCIEADTGK